MYNPRKPTYPPPHNMQQPLQTPPLISIKKVMNQPQMNRSNQMGQPPMSKAQGVLPSQGVPQSQEPIPQQQGLYRQTILRVPCPRQLIPGQKMPIAPIASRQHATSESAESGVIQPSDSVYLSSINQPPKPDSPENLFVEAVEKIMRTNEITITPTAKARERQHSTSETSSPLNVKKAVGFILSEKQSKKPQESETQIVNLTNDTPQTGPKSSITQKVVPNVTFPFRCHHCTAQYPNSVGLAQHIQNNHKTSAGNVDVGIPLINLRQPGVLRKLGQLGIHNFIPLPTPQQDGTFAIPIINSRNPANVQAIGATTMLMLGPVKTIPRPGNASANAQKQSPSQQKLNSE